MDFEILPHNCHPNYYIEQYLAPKYVQMERTTVQLLHTLQDPTVICNQTNARENI